MNLCPARSLVVLSLLVLLGCKAETFGGEDPAAGVSPVAVVGGFPIAGGRVTLAAPWLATSPDTLLITVDGSAPLPAIRATTAIDHFWLTLPDGLRPGLHQLALRGDGHGPLPIGTIGTGGWAPLRTVPGALSAFTPEILPQLPGLVSMTDAQQIEILDARAGTIRMVDTLHASTHNIYSFRLGSSAAPNSFTMQTGDFIWHRVGLGLAGPVIDSGTPNSLAFSVVHDLGGGAWFYENFGHHSQLDIPGASREFQGHHFAERVAISDDGRWIIPSHETSDSGLLILDRNDWTSRYLPGWGTADASIAANGTGYVLGTRNGLWYQGVPLDLARFDPATGMTAAERMIADSVSSPNASDIGKVTALRVVDAVLVVRPSANALELEFFDPTTLDPIGHLALSDFYSTCAAFSGWEPMVIEDPTFHRIYLTPDYCTGGAVPIATLQLPA